MRIHWLGYYECVDLEVFMPSVWLGGELRLGLGTTLGVSRLGAWLRSKFFLTLTHPSVEAQPRCISHPSIPKEAKQSLAEAHKVLPRMRIRTRQRCRTTKEVEQRLAEARRGLLRMRQRYGTTKA
ncbi:hypothetical protein BHE74_00039032 [Ensete ventricosum]|nr:hypothetical protein BHE74_00039032 [Ensete ventricosum]